jgi:hypothetical protein
MIIRPMKKLFIYGIDKEKNSLRVIVSKKQEFFDNFKELFRSIGVEAKDPQFFNHFGLRTSDKSYDHKPARISSYTDYFQFAKAPGIEIEIFYGYKRVHVLFKANKASQEKILTRVNKFAIWPKAKTRAF